LPAPPLTDCSTTAVSLARLILISRVDMTDITYQVPATLVIGTAEPALGIVCVCMPLLKPVISRSSLGSKGASYAQRSRLRQWSRMADGEHGRHRTTGSGKVDAAHVGDASSETELTEDIGHKGRYEAHVSRTEESLDGAPDGAIRVQTQWVVSDVEDGNRQR
jgi:hypothetical protein